MPAQAKFCYLQSDGKGSIVNFTLQELDNKSDPSVFVRVHQSYIVSIRHVQSFKLIGSGRLEISLKDGSKVQSSRYYSQNIKKMLSG